MISSRISLSTRASGFLLALYGAGTSWAQTPPVPDAGQVLRDLQQGPASSRPRFAPPPRPESPAESDEKRDGGKVLVRSIVITGNEEVSTADLQPLVADLVGAEQTLGQLAAAARRITAYYREHGFAVARAYLPAQDITAGAVIISVIEGRIASHTINNQSRVSDARAQGYFDRIKDGDVIKSAQIDRGLLLLQDTPGVGGSRATLQPGASPGTAELLIEVEPAKACTGHVVADNYGNRYTGAYRLAGAITFASPFKIGDELTINALTSGAQLNYGRVSYQRPVGRRGLRLGAAGFSTDYQLGKEFEVLEAHGTARSATVFAAYPFVRSRLKNLSGLVSVEGKRLKDYVDATAIDTARTVTLATLGLSGTLQDTLGGGGLNRLDVAVTLGNLRITSPGARALDDASARTQGGYHRVFYSLSRLQRLTDSAALFLTVSGQQAGRNLDSSEKISLGGINGVRAYPQSEATGDEGAWATLEFRHNFRPTLQGTLFYDAGRVTANHHPFDPAAANHRTLSGAGVGFNAGIATFQFKASLAWRTSGGAPASIPVSVAKTPTLWLQANVVF